MRGLLEPMRVLRGCDSACKDLCSANVVHFAKATGEGGGGGQEGPPRVG
jgi:hypothetical protein